MDVCSPLVGCAIKLDGHGKLCYERTEDERGRERESRPRVSTPSCYFSTCTCLCEYSE